MNLPIEIYQKIEERLSHYKISDLKVVVNTLIDNYKNESGQGHNLISDELSAWVYAAYRLPATYKAIYSALVHTLEFYDENILSLLDVGAGTGAASLAALSLLNLSEITCLEKDENMIKVGQYLLEDKASYISFDLTKQRIDKTADLVVSGYVLNELSPEDIELSVKKMWDNTNKVLLVVEPGTPKGYQVIQKVREILIEEGGYIIAPCPYIDRCLMHESDWCHFSTRVQRGKLHKLLKEGDAPYEDEKYSYIAFAKSPCKRCASRILRHPQINKGNVSLVVCDQTGINKVTVSKKQGELYKRARKSDAGDYLE